MALECYYLPCVKPENMVDYIFVGMEPSAGGGSQRRRRGEEG